MLLQQGQNGGPALASAVPAGSSADGIEELRLRLKSGWTVHLTRDNRLYYCNHLTQTSSWIPPAESWTGSFPYGWEEAFDHDGKPYFINHSNKTTTYEDPRKDWSEEPPVPREITLMRHPEVGFGFVAGSEKPVIVRFVTEGGPSVDLLQPGDQILSVNGEDVKKAPRDHVIKLVRGCKDVVHLTVCQPPLDNSARKSALLSAAKKAKLKSNPSRVRFAEGVVVNGSPLFPPSTFSNGEPSIPVLPNVLKVYLENGQTKSFKYDSNTTVRDVVTSLLQKLLIRSGEHFSLVVEHFKSLRRNKLTLLDPNESVARIAARPGSHNLRCLFRVTFVPKEAGELAQKDKVAFEYLYMQCCNDVVQERYAPELKYDLALKLAALHIHQHALAHNLAGKLTVKAVEREFGLERFIPVSLMGTMKRKELRKLLAHFLKLNQNILPGQKSLTSFQAKLHYLTIVGELPSYGAKCFSTNIRDANMETVLLVSPKFGISQILGIRNSAQPVALANIEDMRGVVVRREDELSRTVRIFLKTREFSFSLEDRDAEELVLVLQGYYRLFTGEELAMDEERDPYPEDCAPLYFSPHAVRPAPWSYLDSSDDQTKVVNFSVMPQYQPLTAQNKIRMNGHVPGSKTSSIPNGTKCGVDDNMNIKKTTGTGDEGLYQNGKEQSGDLDFHAMVSMEMSKGESQAEKSDEVQAIKRIAEMQALVMTSEQYLSEQRSESVANPRDRPLMRLQEEEDSDCSHMSSAESEIPYPGQLKHSDSLLLLAQMQNSTETLEETVRNLDIGDAEPSESDTDSASTPAESPSHNKGKENETNRLSSQSFGLHSPDGLSPISCDIQDYLQRLKDDSNIHFEFSEGTLYLDPDIIDLTNIPPPATPDDGVNPLPIQPSQPPMPFADVEVVSQAEPAIYWGEEEQDSLTNVPCPAAPGSDDLEAFLATVTVAPPAPAQEITPEEILSYIIPPPPKANSPVYANSPEHGINGDSRERKREANGPAPFSPKTSRKGSGLCCGGPRGSPDIDPRIPRRGPAGKLQQVSDWPKSGGPLKLSLYNGGGCVGSENMYYGTLPKSIPRMAESAIDSGYRTLPKNAVNGGGFDVGNTGALNRIISARNPGTPRDSPNLSSTLPRNGVVAFRSCAEGSHHHHHYQHHHQQQQQQQQQQHGGHSSPLKLNPENKDVKHPAPRNNQTPRREELLGRSDGALAVLLVKLDQLAAQCGRAQSQGGGHRINQERFQMAKDAVSEEACQLVTASKNLVKKLMSDGCDAELAEGCSLCLRHLRSLSERCTEMAAHTSAPLHTRNIILRVHDVASACRDVLRKPTTQQSEHLANVLTSLLRSLRVFE